MIIKNAVIHTVTNGTFNGYDLRVENGRIVNIRKVLRVMPKEEVFDAQGLHLYPGFVDAHSHIGLWEEGIRFEGDDGNEITDPITPHLRGIDSINPNDEAFEHALLGGVTTACTGPGSANVIGGQFAAIKLYGNRVDDMIISPYIGMKCAFGENPKRCYADRKQTPTTRMGSIALLRETLFKAREYMQKKELAGSDTTKLPDFNMKYEAMIPVLKKEVPLKAHAHRADDIFSAIRVAREFNLKLTLDHCTEGHLIADQLAKENYPALVGPTLTNKSKFELREKSFDTPKVLVKAGVKTAIITDSPVIPLEYLPLCAALAVKSGLSPDDALRCITINPAEIMGIGDRVGSIELGKDADLVLWDGDPLDLNSRVHTVFISGKRVVEKGKIVRK